MLTGVKHSNYNSQNSHREHRLDRTLVLTQGASKQRGEDAGVWLRDAGCLSDAAIIEMRKTNKQTPDLVRWWERS